MKFRKLPSRSSHASAVLHYLSRGNRLHDRVKPHPAGPRFSPAMGPCVDFAVDLISPRGWTKGRGLALRGTPPRPRILEFSGAPPMLHIDMWKCVAGLGEMLLSNKCPLEYKALKILLDRASCWRRSRCRLGQVSSPSRRCVRVFVTLCSRTCLCLGLVSTVGWVTKLCFFMSDAREPLEVSTKLALLSSLGMVPKSLARAILARSKLDIHQLQRAENHQTEISDSSAGITALGSNGWPTARKAIQTPHARQHPHLEQHSKFIVRRHRKFFLDHNCQRQEWRFQRRTNPGRRSG